MCKTCIKICTGYVKKCKYIYYISSMESKTLKAIITQRGIKQKWIAKKLNVSGTLVSGWIKGTKAISDRHSIELQTLLNN